MDGSPSLRPPTTNLCEALRKGIEKVISTIGIHEVRGYAPPVQRDRRQARARRDPRASRASAPPTAAASASPSSTRRATSATRRSAPETRARQAGKTSASTRRSGRPLAPSPPPSGGYEEYSREGRELEAEQPDLAAPHHGAASSTAPRTDPGRRGQLDGRPPRLPDRDQLDELRLAVRDRLPRLRRGGEASQHPLHQRRGRRDPTTCTGSTASTAASRSPRAASASRRC